MTEPEAEGGINWKELCVDKSIDVVLVPLGLFAALWFQGWVDDRKEKEDFKLLLKDFQTEVSTNRDKASAIVDDLGPIADISPEKVLGPLQGKFEEFRADTLAAVGVLDCLDTLIDIGIKAPETLTEADKTAGAECGATLEKADKESAKKFKPVDLSPLYRYEVFQVYLASGIKLFKDPESKQVGLRIGEVYAAAKEVEKRVEEIEKILNDSFMEKAGELAGLGEEAGDLFGDDPTPDDLREIQPRLIEMSQQVLEGKYAITNIEAIVQMKVERLKTYIVDMNAKFDALKAALEAEIAR